MIEQIVKCNRVKDNLIYSIYFPTLSYLVFAFVYNFVGKITMIALKWCNPYTIKAQVNMFWNQSGTGIERERYRL